MGLGLIIDRWIQLVLRFQEGGDYYDIYGYNHPITVMSPTIRSYVNGHLIVEYNIKGIY